MATAPDPVAAPGPMVPAPFVVARRERETADTWTLELDPAGGEAPEIAPGQFVMVYAFGVGEVPISVSAPPLALTVRAVGAVTEAICAAEPGTVLGVRGPFGSAWPIDAAAGADVVVLAGGIGLAPLRPVLLRALARRRDYGEVALLYGARTPADLLYLRELERWRERATVAVTVDAAETAWTGKVGVVPKLVPAARFDGGSAVAFVCGPEIMMRFGVEALLARGIAPGRIHLSLERNMRCGLGHCGHCQLGPTLICRDGPVYAYETAAPWLEVRSL
jgi:anaerobic sulfite reductase subunit B